jgi:TP901 family phage tail tape measure protein/lambda family phage tail tape measure protein
MSDTAKLSLEINTGGAAEELALLATSYKNLKDEFAKGFTAVGGLSALAAELNKVNEKSKLLEQQVSKSQTALLSMERQMAAAATAAAAELDKLNKKITESSVASKSAAASADYLMGVQLRSAEMTGNAIVKSTNDIARAKNLANSLELKVIKAEEAGKIAEAEKATKELARAKNLANSLELKVIKAEEAGKIAEAEKATKELARAKNLANSLELKVIKAEEAGKIVEAEKATKELARAKNLANSLELRVIKAEEAGKIAEAEKATKELARAKNLANNLELKVIKAEEAGKIAEAEKATKELARAKNLANNLELKVISAEQAAAIKAAKRDVEELAAWLAMTEKQRAGATLKAASTLYGGGNQSALKGGAGSSQALAAAQHLGSTQAAQDAFDKLGTSTKAAGDHQIHWNKAANEGHALARGLSGSLGTLWMTYGSLIPMMAGAALGAGFVQAAKRGSEFAYQLTFVKALSGETAQAVDRLTESALTLGSSSLQGPGEIASGFRILAQAGLNASDAIKTMPHALHLATVGEMNMEQAATTLVGVMNAFNLTVDQSQHVGDIFAKAAALSQTSVQGMTEAMKYASVVGEQYGANIEDTATAITLLAKVNITGTSAGTAFRNMLKELYSPTNQASQAIKKLGLETQGADGNLRPFVDIIYDLKGKINDFSKADQVKILQKIFGERGAKEAIAMLALTRDEWDKLRSSIADSEGFMDGVAKELEDTAKGKWAQALNTMEAQLIRAFKEMEPELKNVADQFKTLFGSPEFLEGVKAVVSSMTTITKALVEFAPTILSVVEAFAIYKIGMIGAQAATAAWLAVVGGARTAMVAFGLATAATSATTAAAGVGMMALGGPIGIVAGLLSAGVVAWALYGDSGTKHLDRIREQAERVKGSIQGINDLISNIHIGKLDRDTAARNIMDGYKGLSTEEDKFKKDLEGQFGGKIELDMGLNIKGEGPSKMNLKAFPELDATRKRLLEMRGKLDEASRVNADRNVGENGEVDLTSAGKVAEEQKKRKKWADEARSGGGGGASARARAPKDYDFKSEEAAINRVKEQQKAEMDILDSARSNNLISEEKYRLEAEGIYKKYGTAMDYLYSAGATRLQGIVDKAQGDELKQARMHQDQLKTSQEKYQSEETLRLQKSKDRELGIIKKAHEDTLAFIDQAQADVKLIKEKDNDARVTQTMTPEQRATHTAEKNVDKVFDKKQVTLESDLKRTRDIYGEESALVKSLAADLEMLKEKRAEARAEAGANAGAEVEYARSLESGWKNAFRDYADSATDYSKLASDAFNKSAKTMEDVIVGFATTGKFEWKALGNSILTEMIRIGAQQAVLKAMGTVTGLMGNGVGSNGGSSMWGTLGGAIANYFVPGSGGLISGAASAAAGGGAKLDSSAYSKNFDFAENAKGGAYGVTGLHAFAKGASFTNQVVNQPTFFKFANGGQMANGVMGEAGEEAIMPLTRDSKGRLGVNANGNGNQTSTKSNVTNNNVNVNVNSSTGDTAEIRRSAAAGARVALQYMSGAQRYG